jgi:hypothetical protein
MPLMQRDGSTTYWQRPQLETRRVSSWKKLKVSSLINCAKKKKQIVTQNSQITVWPGAEVAIRLIGEA